jgi:hypothetical protein
MGKSTEINFDFEPQKVPVGPQNGLIPAVKFQFGRLQKEKCPRVKFDFEPLNPKSPSGPPKWAKAPGVKFEFGSLFKRTNSLRIKFEFGPIKIVVGGPQKMGKSPRKKFILVVANSVL